MLYGADIMSLNNTTEPIYSVFVSLCSNTNVVKVNGCKDIEIAVTRDEQLFNYNYSHYYFIGNNWHCVLFIDLAIIVQ